MDEPGEIASATQFHLGWGLNFFDYDNDGSADLLLANDHPEDLTEIRWPSGRVDKLANPPVNRYVTVVESESVR